MKWCRAFSFGKINDAKKQEQTGHVWFLLRRDLALTNYHILRHQKKHLAEQNFNEDDEIKIEIEMCFEQQAVNLYSCVLQKLYPDLTHAWIINDNYLEK